MPASADNVRAVTQFAGYFRQGDTGILKIKISDFDGSPVDPEYIEIAIYAESNVSADPLFTGTPFQVESGYYVYKWEVASDQALGDYTVDWYYSIDGTAKHEYQYITIVDDPTTDAFYSTRMMAWRTALDFHISCAQSIPIYFEQARPTRDRQTYQFTFPRWNQSSTLRIFRNKEVVNSGVEVDFFRGQVTFDDILAQQETVNADYNFQWFSEEDLDRFLNNSLQMVNTFPPHSAYTLENIPDRYIPAVLYGASKDALRQLMMCLQFQEPQQIFGGPDNAQKAFSNFETLKKNYENDWKTLIDQKKLGPYTGLTRAVVVPEYTLPGGRSRWFRYLFGGSGT